MTGKPRFTRHLIERSHDQQFTANDEHRVGSREHTAGQKRLKERDDLRKSHAAQRDALMEKSMRGNVGWLADHTVEENDKVSPRWIKYRAFVEPVSEDLADANSHLLAMALRRLSGVSSSTIRPPLSVSHGRLLLLLSIAS